MENLTRKSKFSAFLRFTALIGVIALALTACSNPAGGVVAEAIPPTLLPSVAQGLRLLKVALPEARQASPYKRLSMP